MKKSEFQSIVKEIVRNSIEEIDNIQDNQFVKNNPDQPMNAGSKFSSGVPGVWDNTGQVEQLKQKLTNALDAGNFQVAHQLVDQLSNYHN